MITNKHTNFPELEQGFPELGIAAKMFYDCRLQQAGTIYSNEALKFLDKHIMEFVSNEDSTGDPRLDADLRVALILTIGAYVGEHIIHNFGGEWYTDKKTFYIVKLKSITAYPVEKVQKRIELGIEDSLLWFVKFIGSMESDSIDKIIDA
jgi:hypothetical protein